MISVLPSIAALGVVAIAAVWLTIGRLPRQGDGAASRSVSRALGAATGIQSAHFLEEWATGFHVRFPALFGLEPMPLSFFVTFNVVWIAIWLGSIRPVRQGRNVAFFAAWFLALAGVLNGIAHPALALAAVGYFPGLITSPFIGIAAALLLIRLRVATAPRSREGV